MISWVKIFKRLLLTGLYHVHEGCMAFIAPEPEGTCYYVHTLVCLLLEGETQVVNMDMLNVLSIVTIA